MALKKTLAIFSLILLISIVQAQSYSIARHEIQVKVKSDGFATVSEKYFLTFPNDRELAKFKDKAQNELGVSLANWREFNNQIHVYIAGENNIAKGIVSFDDSESEKYLKLEYGTTVPIMQKTSETTRIVEFALNKQYFSEFNQKPFWVIPSNTIITVYLPVNGNIAPNIQPEAIVSENRIVWVGYKTSNALTLTYSLEKQIAPNFELTQFIQKFFNSQISTILIILTILVSVILYIKRKTVSEKIEDYIVKHSEFETKEEEKELELE